MSGVAAIKPGEPSGSVAASAAAAGTAPSALDNAVAGTVLTAADEAAKGFAVCATTTASACNPPAGSGVQQPGTSAPGPQAVATLEHAPPQPASQPVSAADNSSVHPVDASGQHDLAAVCPQVAPGAADVRQKRKRVADGGSGHVEMAASDAGDLTPSSQAVLLQAPTAAGTSTTKRMRGDSQWQGAGAVPRSSGDHMAAAAVTAETTALAQSTADLHIANSSSRLDDIKDMAADGNGIAAEQVVPRDGSRCGAHNVA
jgi:hypothetical protein